MLLYERPVYNEKLQQDIDLEGGEWAERLVVQGVPLASGFVQMQAMHPAFLVSLRGSSDTSIYLVAPRTALVTA